MGTQIITLSLPAELLVIINEAAKDNYCNRSDYIRESVVLRLKDQYKDPGKLKPPTRPASTDNPDDEIWV